MKAARLYGQVWVDVALKAASGDGDFATALAELRAFSQTLFSSPLAVKTFESPAVSSEEKQKMLNALGDKASLGALSRRFVLMLNQRGRLRLLPEILREVETLQIEKRGGVIGEVTSAAPLDAPVLAEIAEALGKRIQKPVHLTPRVDPAVIAGIKVTVAGVTYDGTVRSKLDRIANQI
jgi:F-type H+-transporting ATPase subunit delta